MNVKLSHIKELSTLPYHYDTRSTIGSPEDRRGHENQQTNKERQPG